MKTYMAKKGEVKAAWHVVDLTDKVLGRAATKIAMLLMGKHRPEYTPNVDTGDFVIIVNAAKVKIIGDQKQTDRTYDHYTNYPGHLKQIPLGKMFARRPNFVVTEAIRRMLPKNNIGRAMLKKLKVYTGPTHRHQAQNPQPLEV